MAWWELGTTNGNEQKESKLRFDGISFDVDWAFALLDMYHDICFGDRDLNTFNNNRHIIRSFEQSQNNQTTIVALSFHQMFECMSLGSCLSEAKFKIGNMAKTCVSFSLTTPIGIAIGYGTSKTYDENSHLALILEGVFTAASAGILIYMALIDLLAVDFINDGAVGGPAGAS
ncbi:hypothetical protein CTI12_AA176770 [Artemisia annua]|uniref:Uncharacterized protein n=1 Tax=Artemisia annua TaxID=35608 RepID=A0A2U1P727_ARTAN|nr:hypothetical protein CTI12_AA176770 [Artemisia annua]